SDATVGADGELHFDGSGATPHGRLARVLGVGQADRTQGVGHRRRLLLLLGRWRRRRRGRLARGWFGRRCLGAPRGCRRRRGFLCGTLLLQAARGLLLRALLIGQALALQFGAALGLLLGAQLFALLALGQFGAAVGDRLLQAWQRRMAGIGLLEQRVEALGLVEVVAADALLGRDQGIGLQVGQ